jgi:OOP family OmpA-OmpF porin
MILAGYVARDEDRQSILASARRVSGTAEVVDNLTFGAGAPAGFPAAAAAVVRSLSRLGGGRGEISDRSVMLVGTTYQEGAVTAVADSLRDALPAGFALSAANLVAAAPGQPLAAAACREQLQAILKSGRIEFDANTATVTAESLAPLDRAAATILRCTDATVEVAVHSDNDGGASTLRERTQTRAEAVVDYLVAAGIQRERLTAVGHGGTKPIAENNTAAGRAANRRVELTVTETSGG